MPPLVHTGGLCMLGVQQYRGSFATLWLLTYCFIIKIFLSFKAKKILGPILLAFVKAPNA